MCLGQCGGLTTGGQLVALADPSGHGAGVEGPPEGRCQQRRRSPGGEEGAVDPLGKVCCI